MRDKMSKNRVNSKNFPPAAIFPKRYLYKGVFLIDFSQKVPIQGVPLIDFSQKLLIKSQEKMTKYPEKVGKKNFKVRVGTMI